MFLRILPILALLLLMVSSLLGCGDPTVQAPPAISPTSPVAATAAPDTAVSTASPSAATAAPDAVVSAAPPSAATATDVGAPADAATADAAAAAAELKTVVLYSQPPDPAGGLLHSSLRDPDGSETDQWTWDSFAFDKARTLTGVHWRGVYDPDRRGTGGPVRDFTVQIYGSIPSGIEPDITKPPLVHYEVGGNAGEAPAEVLAGVQTYEYEFVLPAPFEAEAWTQYWIQIEALQSGVPDWGLAKGTSGDLQYFRRIPGQGYNYWTAQGDAAFDLLGPGLASDVPAPEVTKSPEEIAALVDALPPIEEIPVDAGGVQSTVLVVSRSGYTPGHFAVKAGVPVRLTFRQLGYVPGGNILLIYWDDQPEIPLILTSPGDSEVIEFTPQVPGDYRFRCPHDWYEGVMTVQE
jgi:hypothetical protein